MPDTESGRSDERVARLFARLDEATDDEERVQIAQRIERVLRSTERPTARRSRQSQRPAR